MLPLFAMPQTPLQTLPTAVAILQTTDDSSQVICSGVPIDSKIILTAAHCLAAQSAKFIQTRSFSIMSRGHKHPSKTFRVSRWLIHPQYKTLPQANREDFDVAILETENALQEAPGSDRPEPSFRINIDPSIGRLWILGFSPGRLKMTEPEKLLESQKAWSPVNVRSNLIREGKFEATASSPGTPAACPGDSGAPVWDFQSPHRRLLGIVVQANCEKGLVKFVDLARYAHWVKQMVHELNEASSNPKVASNNDLDHQYSKLHNNPWGHE
ncbi:MAG: trypsin-like serine protease [Silvanigrellaceae bacterium]